ncbi:MAG: hypothetical protein AAF198_10430 [Pseudomonadota bacterium]
MRTLVLSLIAAFVLSGCFYGTKNVSDSAETVQAAAYQHDGPPTITLYTSINNTSGAGAHSALLVNGPERILYDPAGRFRHPDAPEQADVHFGITDRVLSYFYAHHALPTHHLRIRTLIVSPEVAKQVYHLARSEGRSVDAACTNHVSNVLMQIDGWDISRTIFPRNLDKQFATIPGVTTKEIRKGDSLIP